MVLPQFEYFAPDTLEEACKLLHDLGPAAKVMAGGTDLVPPMKDKVLKIDYCIDLKRIQELEYLNYDEEGLKIGCLTKLFDIQTSALVHQVNPSIAASAKFIASTQVRNKGTMVGNICNASPSCDTAPILIAQNAKVLVQGYDHSREILVRDLFKGVKRTVLFYDEIVTGIVVPPLAADECAAYTPLTVRQAMDLCIAGVAAWLKMDGNVCVDARLALGAVAPTPVRAYSAEKVIIGKELTDEIIAAAGVAAMRDCKPVSDVRASAEYRHEMIRVFTKRAIRKALEGYGEELH